MLGINQFYGVFMPIYEYQCQSCGHEYEALQKLNDPALTECPACKKPDLAKKISAAGFRLKGGGWYETDFKSGSKKNVAGETAAASTSTSTAASAGGCGSGACGKTA
jgi:putative FmdB family regulatory protein